MTDPSPAVVPRADGRAADEIRAIEVVPRFLTTNPGSVLYRCGGTRVLCVATLSAGIPPWLSEDQGWLTAEYSMLPGATVPRKPRSRETKLDGRTQEIQRLIGRSLRAAVDRRLFPRMTIHIDCDVLEADGGTRSAAISGATIALGIVVETALEQGRLQEDPRVSNVVAVSAGLVDGVGLLDLDYSEDRRAELDLNIVGTQEGHLVEIQGSSESDPLPGSTWAALTDLGTRGLAQVGAQVLSHVPAIGE